MSKSLKPSLNARRGYSSLACNTCNTDFCNENDLYNHYNSEWHRYNLKCKIAGFPGVTKALFLTRQTTLAKEKNKLDAPSKQYSCGLCGKGFGSSEAHAQHLNSQSHITRAIQDGHLNQSKTIVKTLAVAPHMVNKLSQNEEKNKLNAPYKRHTCGPCGKGFGSSEAYTQHLNSQSHITRAIQDGSSEAYAQHLNSRSHTTRAIQDGHLNESKTKVKTLAPHMVNKLSQHEEKNKLNVPSKLYTCGPCVTTFGSFEAYAQHLNSQSHHRTQEIHDGNYLNERTTVKTLAPHMVNKLSQNEEKNKLNAPSTLYTCGLSGKGFGNSEAHAQHLRSRSHITQEIQDGHLNESTTIVKTLAPHTVNSKGFGSSEARAQHLNSQSHITRVIQDGRHNESKTIVKPLAPHMLVNKLSQDEEKNKLSAPSKLYSSGLCGKGFGSAEAHPLHLNSQSHRTQVIQDCHLNESKKIVKTLAPCMANKLSQNEDEWEEVHESNEWEEVDGNDIDQWEEVDASDEWEKVGE